MLTGGDISKEAWILGHVTPAQSEPYIQRQTETRLVDYAILSYFGVNLPWMPKPAAPKSSSPPIPQDQPIGAACQGTLIDSCLPIFVDKLAVACRTCPGPKQ